MYFQYYRFDNSTRVKSVNLFCEKENFENDAQRNKIKSLLTHIS